MPVYEYQCTSCGRRIEVIRGVTAVGLTTCEACGGPLRKLLTVPAILYKGSGWAKKDARSIAHPAADTAPAAASGDGGASEAAKQADAKHPDAKQADAKQADAKPPADRSAGKEHGAPARSRDPVGGSSTGSSDSG